MDISRYHPFHLPNIGHSFSMASEGNSGDLIPELDEQTFRMFSREIDSR